MDQPIVKSHLSPAQARLVELLQGLNFGRVEALTVRAGEPVFEPPPRVIQTVKIGADNCPRPEVGYADFRLKHQIVEMLEIIGSLGEGELRAIDVRHGLPYNLEIERRPDFAGENSASHATLAGESRPMPCRDADALRTAPGRTIYLGKRPPGHFGSDDDGGAR